MSISWQPLTLSVSMFMLFSLDQIWTWNYPNELLFSMEKKTSQLPIISSMPPKGPVTQFHTYSPNPVISLKLTSHRNHTPHWLFPSFYSTTMGLTTEAYATQLHHLTFGVSLPLPAYPLIEPWWLGVSVNSLPIWAQFALCLGFPRPLIAHCLRGLYAFHYPKGLP